MDRDVVDVDGAHVSPPVDPAAVKDSHSTTVWQDLLVTQREAQPTGRPLELVIPLPDRTDDPGSLTAGVLVDRAVLVVDPLAPVHELDPGHLGTRGTTQTSVVVSDGAHHISRKLGGGGWRSLSIGGMAKVSFSCVKGNGG